MDNTRTIRVLTSSRVKISRIRGKMIHSRPLPIQLELPCQFPPEIIQVIVKASLAPYDSVITLSHNPASRYTILKKYSLLNSTWRGVSEPLLYEWVVVKSLSSAFRFLERRGLERWQ